MAEETEREALKKELRELLIFKSKKVADILVTRMPGGFVYRIGSTSVFAPYDEVCALDLRESEPTQPQP